MRNVRPPRTYSKAELKFLRAHRGMKRKELLDLFVKRFGRSDVSLFNLTDLMYRKRWLNGLAGPRVFYSEDELRFLERHKEMPRAELHALFVKRFGRAVTLTNIESVCCRHRILTGRATDNAEVTIGTERVGRSRYVVVKTAQGVGRKNFVLKHRMLWEKANGPIPRGHKLKCITTDKTNTDPSNWDCVPIGVMNRLRARKYDDAPAILKPSIMAAAKLEHAAARAAARSPIYEER